MFYQYQHYGLSEYFCKEYGKNFSFPTHLHQSFEFITIFSGKMTVTVGNTQYILTKGESLLIFPHQPHSLQSNLSEHLLCIFSPEILKAFSAKISKKLPKSNKFVPSPHTVASIDNLTNDSSLIRKKGVLYSLCAEFDENAEYTETHHTDTQLLYKIFDFVESSYKEECSLSELSKSCTYDYHYLSRYFKKAVGISFNHFVNQYRINNACYLLKNSNNSILQCALESGYKSLRSFNRNFKSIIGVTPKEYKDIVVN